MAVYGLRLQTSYSVLKNRRVLRHTPCCARFLLFVTSSPFFHLLIAFAELDLIPVTLNRKDGKVGEGHGSFGAHDHCRALSTEVGGFICCLVVQDRGSGCGPRGL